MGEKKKSFNVAWIGLGIWFLLVLFFSGCVKVPVGSEDDVTVDMAKAYRDVYIAPQDIDIRQEAIEKGDYKICEQIAERWETTKRTCYEDVARKLKDPSICKDYPQKYQENCVKAIETEKENIEATKTFKEQLKERAKRAVANNNVSICERDGWCVTEYAIEKRNASLCEKFHAMQLITQFDEEECIAWIAAYTNNPELCPTRYCMHHYNQIIEQLAKE